MTKRKSNNHFFKDNFSFVIELAKESKIKIIISSILILIAILTGVIIAIKTHSYYKIGQNYGVVDVASGGLTTTFFARFFSMLLIGCILLGCSYIKYLYPLAMVFLCYRAYLLGLNIALMLILYGLPGVIISLIVALPCQMFALIVLGMFYICMSQTFKEFKFYSCKTPKQKMKIIFFTLILLFVVCVVESLLLWIFSAKIILVI